jgi:hypothetical protein
MHYHGHGWIDQFVRSMRGEAYLRTLVQRATVEQFQELRLSGVLKLEQRARDPRYAKRAQMKMRLIEEEARRRQAGGQPRT